MPFATFGSTIVLAFFATAAIYANFSRLKFLPVARRTILFVGNFIVFFYLLPPTSILALFVATIFCFFVAEHLRRLKVTGEVVSARAVLSCTLSLLTLALIFLKVSVVEALFFGSELTGSWTSAQKPIVVFGSSYFFFKMVHVLVDCARGRIRSLDAPAFFVYALFVPTLPSGPMARYQEFERWFLGGRAILYNSLLWASAYRIILGAFKVYFLDLWIEPYALDFDRAFPGASLPVRLICSLVAYSTHIYVNFSGYSDIAIGMSYSLGFKAPENFNNPYLSQNISEFWRRWHITLSSLLRQYLFLPIVRSTGRRFPRLPRAFVSIFGYLVTFILCGLWHEISLGFALWGLWHGVGLSVNLLWRRSPLGRFVADHRGGIFGGLVAVVSTLLTFGFVTFGWLFFNYPIGRLEELLRYVSESKVQVGQADLELDGKITAQPQFVDHENWGLTVQIEPSRLAKTMRIYVKEKGATNPLFVSRLLPAAPGTIKLPEGVFERASAASIPIIENLDVTKGITSADRDNMRSLLGMDRDLTKMDEIYTVGLRSFGAGKTYLQEIDVKLPLTPPELKFQTRVGEADCNLYISSLSLSDGSSLGGLRLDAEITHHWGTWRTIAGNFAATGWIVENGEGAWLRTVAGVFGETGSLAWNYCNADVLPLGQLEPGNYVIRLRGRGAGFETPWSGSGFNISLSHPVSDPGLRATAHVYTGRGVGILLTFKPPAPYLVMDAQGRRLDPLGEWEEIAGGRSAEYPFVDWHGSLAYDGRLFNKAPGRYEVRVRFHDGRAGNAPWYSTKVDVPEYLDGAIEFLDVPRSDPGPHWRRK